MPTPRTAPEAVVISDKNVHRNQLQCHSPGVRGGLGTGREPGLLRVQGQAGQDLAFLSGKISGVVTCAAYMQGEVGLRGSDLGYLERVFEVSGVARVFSVCSDEVLSRERARIWLRIVVFTRLLEKLFHSLFFHCLRKGLQLSTPFL